MRNIHGKLVKTFGFGKRYVLPESGLTWDDEQQWDDTLFWHENALDTSIDGTVYNIGVFVHDELTAGRILIAETIDPDTNEVTLLYWGGAGWRDIDYILENELGSYYHKLDSNPAFQVDRVLRFLPGNVGTLSGNEAKGIWIGYIGRDLFDGLYRADVEYDSGFYAYDTELERPDVTDLNVTLETSPSGDFNPDDETNYLRHYKFSYIYDGIQESMLSDSVAIEFDKEEMLVGQLQVDAASLCRRITAIKIYRAITAKGDYRHIHTIDFLRGSDKPAGGSSGAYAGSIAAYIPELATFDFDSETNYGLMLYNADGSSGTGKAFASNISGTGHDVFVVDAPAWNDLDVRDGEWKLYDADDVSLVQKGQTGAWGGKNVVIVDEDTGYKNHIGGLIDVDELNQRRLIVDNYNKAVVTGEQIPIGYYGTGWGAIEFASDTPYDTITLTGKHPTDYGFQEGHEIVVSDSTSNDGTYTIAEIDESGSDGVMKLTCSGTLTTESGVGGTEITSNGSDVEWHLMDESKGFYYMSKSLHTITVTFFDNFLADGSKHPFPHEKSIKMNGQYATILKDMLFLGDMVLDPGGEDEKRESWIGYSLPGCYDCMPVSRVKIMHDREGGPLTGLGTSFGSLMAFKEHAYMRMPVGDVSSPDTWIVKEAPFERGNIATKGVLQAGDSIYIVGFDGIYEANANLAAATDETPLIKSRISEPINDQFLALGEWQKKDIRGFYDQIKNEIVFRFEANNIWAYNIVSTSWRRVDQDLSFDVTCLDENANILLYDNVSGALRSTAAREAVQGSFTTKEYPVSSERRKPIRRAFVRYKSAADLRVFLYADDSTVPSATAILRPSAEVITKEVPLRYRCKKFHLAIEDTASKDSWEFHGLQIR